MITTQHCEEQRVSAWRAEAIHRTSSGLLRRYATRNFPRLTQFRNYQLSYALGEANYK